MDAKSKLIHTFGRCELFETGKGEYLLVERVGSAVHRTKLSKKDAQRWIASNNYRTSLI